MANVAGFAHFNPGNIAAEWWLGGCATIPIKNNGTKAPIFQWKSYQQQPPDAEKIKLWFETQYPNAGVAVICGAASGGLEMLELEGRAFNAESLARIETVCHERGILDLWHRLTREGYTERTPSGGLHLLYRITDNPVPGNTAIARRYATDGEYTDHERSIVQQRPTWRPTRVLVETRGEGGYVIVAPTSGACHPSGQPWVTLTGKPGEFLDITWGQRELVHAALRSALDEIPVELALPAAERPPRPEPIPGIVSPADDFEAKRSWEENWFTDQGWRVHHREGNEIFWTRPGKDLADGHSATTGYVNGADRLFIWSTSTDLPAEQPLTKFFVYAHYYFNGQLGQCAKQLRIGDMYGHRYGTPLLAPTDFDDFEFDPIPRDQEAGDNVPVAPQQHHLHNEAEIAMPEGGLLFTDTAYAKRMADHYGHTTRYNSTEKTWYIWHPGNSAWQRDAVFAIDSIAENIALRALSVMERRILQGNAGRGAENIYKKAREALSSSRLSAIVTRFKAQPGISLEADAFDNNLDLLNLQNCTYNLATGQTENHNPANMLTMTFGAAYDPDATCPRFLKFMEEVLPDAETRKYVQRALGYSLTGRPNKRVMFLLHGPSGTGKSVLTSVLTRVFGDYGTTAPATTFRLKKNETTVDIHQLRGKRFVATSEMPEGAQLDEELVKRVTGGDIITSRALYESFHHWRPQCVIWIATNFLPRLSSDDNAIWRRAKTIPMRTEFGPHVNRAEIEGLSDQLLQERDGILNWLLDGLHDFRLHGLEEPEAVTRDIEEYRTEMDSVAAWFREEVDTSSLTLIADGRTPTQLLYQRYHSHCSEAGITPLGRARFTKRLSNMSSAITYQKVGGQMTWFGIAAS